jgi:superfamily II DNA helicase RecQ
MQIRFFLVPTHGAEDAAIDLNRFLAAHRILAIERQFVADGPNSAWALCVSFDDGGGSGGAGSGASRSIAGRRGKVDYKDLLSPPEFAVFARLRALRKERAEAEGVPAYALFTNDQLAEMVQRRITTAAALREIPGVGEARVEKYGPLFLPIIEEAALPTATPAPAEDAA